jgi:acyl dehydratase
MTRTTVPVRTGQNLEPRSIGPITQTDIVRFAGAGGDFNPLHHDEAYAKAAGLPGVISIGQMQAGLLAAWVSDLFHVEHVLRYTVRFAAPLFIGDVLILLGEVAEIDTDDRGSVAELTLRGMRGTHAIVTGSARVRVSPLD